MAGAVWGLVVESGLLVPQFGFVRLAEGHVVEVEARGGGEVSGAGSELRSRWRHWMAVASHRACRRSRKIR
ncbi:hypothetical protein ACFPP6_02360 [Streptomyces aureoversilis]|uniref:Uncharacterized protein n=2 Tax=Streptomyces aureoversilis TaxID=67277 RepID=A0ABV9ZTQ9_9ACTN